MQLERTRGNITKDIVDDVVTDFKLMSVDGLTLAANTRGI